MPADRGPGKDPRPIVVHDVEDRIVQRSILNVLMGINSIMDTICHPMSFGGLPKLGPPKAIREACLAISEGKQYYLRSDIEDFFSNIPRRSVLDQVSRALPDKSLDELLEDATRVELENLDELGPLVEHFPSEETGVPQGNSLSAFLGNFLLRPFDETMNSGECITLRYLDDFLILGPDAASVWSQYREGNRLLSGLGLRAYHPHKSAKAEEGSVKSGFDFLGCEISEGFVRPSRENQRKLLERIRKRIEVSRRLMEGDAFGSPHRQKFSLTRTLYDVGQSVHSWRQQFSYCNDHQVMEKLDRQIEKLLREYLGVYADRKSRVSNNSRRRMLGVPLLQDVDLPRSWPVCVPSDEED